MQTIQQYNAPSGALRPNEAGEQALDLEARMSGRLGEERAALIRQGGESLDRGLTEAGRGIDTLGQVVERHEAQTEIIAGQARLMNVTDELDKAHQAMLANSDLFDPEVGQRYRDAVNNVMGEFPNDFKTPAGREWAITHAGTMATELHRQSMAADMQHSSDMAKIGIDQTVNTASSIVTRNPAMLDTTLSTIPGTIDALGKTNPSAKGYPGLAHYMGREIASAGIKAQIDANPDAGRALLSSGRYDQYINGTEANTLREYADHVDKMNIEQQKSNAAAQTKAEKEQYNGAINNLISSTITPNGPALGDYWKKITPILALPGASQSHDVGQALVNYGRAVTKEAERGTPTITDPHTYLDMSTRIFLPEGDPRQLTLGQVAQARGSLSPKDFDFLKWAVTEAPKDPVVVEANKQFNDFIGGYKKFITGSTMLKSDAIGDERLSEFERDKRAQFQAGLQGGLKPQDMLDPHSKNFIGADIGRYQPTLAQMMQSQSQKVSTGVKPLPPVGASVWKPGMSMDDLAKTLGGH